MIVKRSPTVVYGLWLSKILYAHRTDAWNAEPLENQEREDDWLHELWHELDEKPRQRLWGLSADLATLRDQETWVDDDWPRLTEQELARQQSAAFQRRDWDGFLESLRRPPRFLARPMVDYLRGRAWMEMGHPEVATLFFDNAARLEPSNAMHRVLALECLKSIPDWPKAVARAEQCVLDPDAPPRLIFRAADIFHAYGIEANQADYFQRAIDAVTAGFVRHAHGAQESLPSVLAGAFATKALSLEALQRFDESLAVFDEAISQLPDNTTLLTARGLLKQELGRTDALLDFQAAIDKGCAMVWPYVEAARSALRTGQHGKAQEYCQRGLSVAQRDSAAAILFELLGISLSQLGDSKEAVRRALQTAAQLDPLSEEIRQNLQAFENHLSRSLGGEPHWRLESATSAATKDVYAHLQAAA